MLVLEREMLARWTVPVSEGVGEPALAARADDGGTQRSGRRRLRQLLQGKRRSHFCFRRTVAHGVADQGQYITSYL